MSTSAAPGKPSVRVVNLTQHTVVVLTPDGERLACWAPAGSMARIREVAASLPSLDADGSRVPVAQVGYADEVQGLPDPVPGVIHVVSRVLAGHVDRADLYFPYPEIRDGCGRIIGCGGLGTFGTRSAV